MANAIVDGSTSVIFNKSNKMVEDSHCVATSPQSASKVLENPQRCQSLKSSNKRQGKKQNARHGYVLAKPPRSCVRYADSFDSPCIVFTPFALVAKVGFAMVLKGNLPDSTLTFRD